MPATRGHFVYDVYHHFDVAFAYRRLARSAGLTVLISAYRITYLALNPRSLSVHLFLL